MAAGGKHSDALNENTPSDAGFSGEHVREALDFSDSVSFRAAVHELIELVGEFRAIETVTKAAQQDPRGVPMLVELLRSHSHTADKFGRVIFHATYSQGPEILRLIRKVWAKETDQIVLGRLHMCMMDSIGDRHHDRIPAVANEEIPEWLSMLDGQNPQAKGWIIWLLAALTRHAPQYADKIRTLAMEIVASPDHAGQAGAKLALGILPALNESAFGGDDEDKN